MTGAFAPLAITGFRMSDWHLNEADLKRYPHFDPPISANSAEQLAKNPERVASHKFFPFIRYHKNWNKFAPKGEKGEPKSRPIRYAARRDAYIFSYYRYLLSHLYEEELLKKDLGNNVIAYRRIRKDDGGGKCNIDFAQDAFNEIKKIGDCAVVALDISGYFENLDHSKIKSLWTALLGEEKLPEDHFQVFKNITKYAVVDKERLYERLGHFGVKRYSKVGNPIRGYLTPYKDIPKHLCRGDEFREKIVGVGSKYSNIVDVNFKSHGIPQGAPLSDLLANLYLIEFDVEIKKWMSKIGGEYFRYSDDILLIIPGEAKEGIAAVDKVTNLITKFGDKLKISAKKTQIHAFTQAIGRQLAKNVCGSGSKDGIEYLGFRFDGRNVYVRNSTISNLYRKLKSSARRRAHSCAQRYPDKNLLQLQKLFDYEGLVKQFGRVEDFRELQDNAENGSHRHWTFWTYVNRSVATFGSDGMRIYHQFANFKKKAKSIANEELAKAVHRRDNPSI